MQRLDKVFQKHHISGGREEDKKMGKDKLLTRRPLYCGAGPVRDDGRLCGCQKKPWQGWRMDGEVWRGANRLDTPGYIERVTGCCRRGWLPSQVGRSAPVCVQSDLQRGASYWEEGEATCCSQPLSSELQVSMEMGCGIRAGVGYRS